MGWISILALFFLRVALASFFDYLSTYSPDYLLKTENYFN